MLLLPDMRTFEVASVFEVFAGNPEERANPMHTIRVASPDGGEVELGHGFRVPTERFGRIDDDETLFVPGFDRVDGVIASLDSGGLDRVLGLLRDAHRRRVQIVSACTGAFVLGAAGLLDGVRVTTHWMMAALLASRHPRALLEQNVLYTHDPERRIWTSAGVTASIDLCLAILASEHGHAAAAASARGMVIPAGRHGGQAQYIPARFGEQEVSDEFLSAVQAAVRADLTRRWTTEALAEIAHMTPRTLQRRFRDTRGMSPSHWVTLERLASARELLEMTALRVDQVAHRVGFSAEILRMHFARVLGTTPSRYRETFGHLRSPAAVPGEPPVPPGSGFPDESPGGPDAG